ncbi:putative cytoplasm protein [Naematelia encephala]|uniref:Putative cytoplasm protein n=1 Tax=Naematelia encephala TaxID=71784 RepID=A0A1Y2B536_9TREE|nr:putative cytoplasm protein [Naematelia encephala]
MSKPVIAVVFYSTYGHIGAMAEQVIAGVESTGATVKAYQFQETLTSEILTKMHAGGSLSPKYPIITPDDLRAVDGLIIGAPTRYGRVPAQVSTFFDACGQLWATGALVGKFVTLFTAAASQHGGHETTALTTFPFFAHQGMVYVPIGFAHPKLTNIDSVQGGSAYGASAVTAGDGHLMPTEIDLDVSKYQGKYFADFVATFVRGKQ